MRPAGESAGRQFRRWTTIAISRATQRYAQSAAVLRLHPTEGYKAKVGAPALPSPMGVTGKAARITPRPATIPRDKYVLLATVASSIS